MRDPSNPLTAFTRKLEDFAMGRERGIRNPFVVVPVVPSLEWKITRFLEQWRPDDSALRTTRVRLDHLMPRTPVFRTVQMLPAEAYPERAPDPTRLIERTLQENLTEELVDLVLEEHPGLREPEPPSVLLLLKLGALHPFARASRLLDELDRRGVRSAVGVPFPGQMVAGGKMSFFGQEASHYYPAHQIEGQVGEAELQR
jgi:hypothetical protein